MSTANNATTSPTPGPIMRYGSLTMPVDQIFVHAQRVCASTAPASQIPRNVAERAERAIKQRKEMAAHYSGTNSVQMRAANDAHK